MGLYKRGNVWWYHFTFKGRPVQQSTKVGNKQLARDIEKAAWTQLAREEVGLPAQTERKNPTIGEVLDALEEHFKNGGKKLGKPHGARDKSNFERARKAFPSTMKAEKLTTADVDRYIDRQLKADYAPATINRTLGLIAQAFRRAKIRNAPEFRMLSEKGNERQGFFEAAEFATLLTHLPDDLRDFCQFAYATGWRKGEIASLKWSDVEGDVIRLRGENSKNAEPRSVVLTGELSEIIERRKQLRLVDGVLTHLVFHRDGKPVAEFRKSWASACEKAGMAGRLFHDLRRSAVRDMIRAGVPQSVAMSVSGHKTASMFRRYNITDEKDLRSAIESVEAYRAREREKVVSL